MPVEHRDQLCAWLERGSPLDCAFQCLNEVIVVFDLTGHMRYCNERFTQEVGYTCEEVIGRPVGSMMATEADRQLSIQKLGEALQGHDTVYRAPVLNKAGSELWAEIRASALRGPNGEIIGVLAACSNITPEQLAKVNLEEAVRAGAGEVEALVARLEREVEERLTAERIALSQKKVLCDALDALVANPDLGSFFNVLLKAINDVIESPSAGLWLRVDDTDRAILYTTCPEGWKSSSESDIRMDAEAYENLFVHFVPHLVDVPSRLPALPKAIQEMYSRLGVKATLAVPIKRGESAIGFIAIRRHDRNQFSESEIEVAVAIADIAALALELRRLAEESRGAAILAERNRFAREIHDTLAQEFTAVMLHTSAAKQSMVQGYPGAASEHLEKVRRLAMGGLAEARRSVFALRPSVLENADLGMALKSLVESIRVPGIKVKSKVTGQPYPLLPDTEANLLRIAQEALGNATRHSGATRIDIHLDYSRSQTKLAIRDNGSGFDVQAARGTGFGLESMSERAASLGMTFKIESIAGKGVTIFVKAPHKAQD